MWSKFIFIFRNAEDEEEVNNEEEEKEEENKTKTNKKNVCTSLIAPFRSPAPVLRYE